jgi:hypothetical protein
MFAIVQQIFPFAFAIAWLGGTFALYFRARVKQNAYLRRFEHEIPFFAGDPLFIPASFRAYRATIRVMWEPQSDPALERLRREMWRRLLYAFIWGFGFPLMTFCSIALLTATGYLH